MWFVSPFYTQKSSVGERNMFGDKKNGHIAKNFTAFYNEQNFEKAILNLTEKEKADYIMNSILPEFILYLKDELKNV